MVDEGNELIALLAISGIYCLSRIAKVRVGITRKILEWQYGTELEFLHEFIQVQRREYVFFDGVREFTIDQYGRVLKIREL